MLKSANWLALMCSLSPSGAEAWRFVPLPTDNTINLCNSGSAVHWRVSGGSDPKTRCCYWGGRAGGQGGGQTFFIGKKTTKKLLLWEHWRVIDLICFTHKVISFDTVEIHSSINQCEYTRGCVCVCVSVCVCVCVCVCTIPMMCPTYVKPWGTKTDILIHL